MMKDYISAAERLNKPSRKRVLNDVFLTVCCLGMVVLFVYELLNEVNYVN